MYLLGAHLRRYNVHNYRDISDKLESYALANDDPSVAFRIVQDAISPGRLRERHINSPLKIVKDYADQGFPKAVFLLGQLMECQGKHSEALQFYQKWTEVYAEARQSPPFSQTMNSVELANISKAFAKLLARSGNRAGVEVAIREAAQVYGDPTACYYLAMEFTNRSSPDFETYLVKAAASGNPKAAHELGMLYLNQSRQGIPIITPIYTQTSANHQNSSKESKTSMPSASSSSALPLELKRTTKATAKEWFAVAASSDIGVSQIYLGILLHSEGRAEEGLEWLQAASKSKNNGEWAEAISYLKRIWMLQDTPDLVQVDIETLRKSPGNSTNNSSEEIASLTDSSLIPESYQRGVLPK